jgi:hypothetical protein
MAPHGTIWRREQVPCDSVGAVRYEGNVTFSPSFKRLRSLSRWRRLIKA